MDIDIVVFDDEPCDNKYWEQAFVVVPLSEIYADFQNPMTREPITETAARLRKTIWVEARPEVLSQFDGSKSAA
jgi:7,8-dihydro-6-hydroxymethylpterin-pyrophosphokinase